MTKTTTERITIEPLRAPQSLDGADAEPFLRMVELANAVCRHDAGHDYLDQEPAEVLGFWQAEEDWMHRGFVARIDAETIGAVSILLSREEGATTAEFDLMVDPAHWGEGVEEALVAAVEDEARRLGRSVLQTWTLHRPDGEEPFLPSPTGFGQVPAMDRQTQFFLAAGFSLEQVERNSAFDLRGSFEPVEQMLAVSRDRMGEDYRVVTWNSPTPEKYLDSFAHVLSRMSTDTPAGGLVVEEQTWDADRVRRRDARLVAQRLMVSVAAVEHLPTGLIVAYNELVIGEDRSAATQQYGTLVVREHRGRGLGTVVKCENLLRWRALAPESPRVSTFNAEENRHMLDINEAIGFVAVSYAGAWKKELDGTG
jgi:GNAT superfamily N-acetyltransferase